MMRSAHQSEINYIEEPRDRSRAKFRHFSREVSGEVFDIPEDNRVLFAYETLYDKRTLVGGICFQTADVNMTAPGTNFDSEYYNIVNFLFVKSDFQGCGIGRTLLRKALGLMDANKSCRVQSAERAIGFFEKMGFVKVGPLFESMCGPRLFRFLQNMERG